jgi:hypothetical protein
MLLI